MIVIYLGLFLVASATFAFEISLTRIFSLAQFYHFAFMAVSLALLGFGASGSLLTLAPRLVRGRWRRRLTWLALGCGLCMPGSYMLSQVLPFDSYSIAWDPLQVVTLLLTYLALSVPFALGGLVISIPLSAMPERANRLYGANLAGSAAGCVLAVLLLPRLGGPRTILASGLLGCLAAAVLLWSHVHREEESRQSRWAPVVGTLGGLSLLSSLLFAQPAFLEVRLSPYKGLSQALRYPGSRVVASDWNAYSRVDLVESAGIRHLPGLSYAYRGPLPAQMGLSVDGDDLSPVLLVKEPRVDLAFSGYLPGAVAYALRPGASTLIIEPRGGLDVWAGLAQGAAHITAVDSNPLVVSMARRGMASCAEDVYSDPGVAVIT